jgi:hypothetical protein
MANPAESRKPRGEIEPKEEENSCHMEFGSMRLEPRREREKFELSQCPTSVSKNPHGISKKPNKTDI